MARKTYDWAVVQKYYESGHGFVECAMRFGFSHTAWTKAIRRGVLRIPGHGLIDRRRRYDWAAIQAYYDAGHSYRQCRVHFGFNANAWTKAVKRGELKARARATPLETLLQRSTSRYTVKRRLLEAGILKNECAECGISEWRGRPLSIQVDHINGRKHDHRVENLRMLCPNCHSQTETFAGKNLKLRRSLQDGGRVV